MADLPKRLGVLEYHDIVHAGQTEASGFGGPSAASYKLTDELFAQHLDALNGQAMGVMALDGSSTLADGEILLTFDDGGVGAISVTAPLLEAHGLRGLFFMTTGMIGEPGFLDAGGLRELIQRGHSIGSHSVSHPTRFSALTPSEMHREWRESRDRLEAILGSEVRIGSVPGGYFAPRVAAEAARAGYRWLFTSEPSASVLSVDGCAVAGRYTLRSASPPGQALQFATGAGNARLRATIGWNGKKLLKTLAGPAYLRVRRVIFRDR